jgi:long-chain acyl-CoA synthetase
MTAPFRIPSVLAAGRWWSRDQIEAMASWWRSEIVEWAGAEDRPVAAVIPATAEGVALFVALTSLPAPTMLLSPDPRAWHDGFPPLPVGTAVVLPHQLAHLASSIGQNGSVPHVLSSACELTPRRGEPLVAPLQTPGIVFFTSGSTGAPKPVFRTTKALLQAVTVRLEALALDSGDGLIAGVSLAHGHGLSRLISSMVLGGPLALLEALDHRTALAVLAKPEFTCWSATAHFADVLGRCAITGQAIAPRVCLVSSPIPQAVFDRFRQRFGVPLRQHYSSSETGIIAMDTAPPDRVRTDSVGFPLTGVEIRIGRHPDESSALGEVGRIWVRSPWQMAGYGFPPAVERPGDVNGWWPTRDLGRLEEDGRLALAGRLDDCLRTREGRLVNLGIVANSLRRAEGVRDVAVVPFQSSAGATFGAVLECEPSVTLAALKRHVSNELPDWAWPRALALVGALPRLPNGKADRQSCADVLRSESSL